MSNEPEPETFGGRWLAAAFESVHNAWEELAAEARCEAPDEGRVRGLSRAFLNECQLYGEIAASVMSFDPAIEAQHAGYVQQMLALVPVDNPNVN